MFNIYIKIQNLVMSIHSKIKSQQENSVTTVDTLELSRDEIIWLMNLIKDGTFKGRDVQTVYETVVKLQLMLNKQG